MGGWVVGFDVFRGGALCWVYWWYSIWLFRVGAGGRVYVSSISGTAIGSSPLPCRTVVSAVVVDWLCLG